MTYLATDRDILVKAAHAAVQLAIREGRLPKQKKCKCVDCGKRAQCYDHRDYRKPLDVEPVCKACNNKRGPGLPLLAKEDAGAYKREWLRENVGKTYRNLDAGEGFAPLDARLNGLSQIELESVLARNDAEFTYKESERKQLISDRRKQTITARDGNRFLGAIPGQLRDYYFKEHDPWFSPFF